jgi:peroxiredoxin
MKIMSSRDYIPEVYIDSNKEVKAFVLRRATAMEKSQMIEMEMEDDMSGKSDLIGKKAIPFSVSDIAGNRFDLDDLKGKVIVLNFWFVECKPCVMEMPDLNKLVEKYKGSEVVFLGLAINEKPAIETFLKTTTFNYTIIPDAKAAIRSYNINAFPAHIVIDRNSTVSFSTTGLAPNTIETIDGIIKSLLVSGAQ